MSKNSKNEELNFLYLDEKYIKKGEKETAKKVAKKKNDKKNKQKVISKTSNKRQKFDFDEETIIGVKKESKQKTTNRAKKGNTQPKNTQKKTEELLVNITNSVEKKKGASKTTAPKKRKIVRQAKVDTKRNKVATGIVKWTVLMMALLAAFIFFMMSPLFNIVEITVTNNQKIQEDTIISLSGIQLGENLYRTSTSTIQRRMKENAYIDSVTVSRRLPNRLELSVKERKATFMLTYASSYAYMNNQGYILEISEQKIEAPIIIGSQTKEEELTVGGRIKEEDLDKLAMVLKIIESANGNGIGDLITKIDISNKQDYLIILESKGKIIHLGDASNLSNRMLYVKAILEKEEGVEGEIHVEGDLNKDNVFFREKE